MTKRGYVPFIVIALVLLPQQSQAGKFNRSCAKILNCLRTYPVGAALISVPSGLAGGYLAYEQSQIPLSRVHTPNYQRFNVGISGLKAVQIGDSLSTSFHASDTIPSMARMRTKPRQRNWFLDANNGNSIVSEFERLSAVVPCEFVNFATPRATVDGDPRLFHNERSDKWILKSLDLSDQVDRVLEESLFQT